MKPNEVNESNEELLLNTVYNYKQIKPAANALIRSRLKRSEGQRRRRAKFKVGDHVRLSKYRKLFDKGYTRNWTTEIFTIRKVQYQTDPITYLLYDYQNEEVKGSVYAEELQKVQYPNIYLVEKILRKKNGKVYVKWLGFGSEHNSWIPEKDVL